MLVHRAFSLFAATSIGFVLTLVSASAAPTSESPSIQARITTPWPAASIVVQYLESLSFENSSLLHPFLQHLTSSTDLHPDTSPKHVYDTLESHLVLVTPNDEAALAIKESLRWAMAIKESSVRIEAMRLIRIQHRRRLAGSKTDVQQRCEQNWLAVGKNVVCDLKTLKEMVSNEIEWSIGEDKVKIYDFDHLYPSSSASIEDDRPLLVFYATPTSASFAEVYRYLVDLADRGQIRFLLRWTSGDELDSDGDPLFLSGYGAGLDIKKSDYLAIDDRLSSGSEPKSTPTSSSDDSSVSKPTMIPVKKDDIPWLSVRSAAYILNSSSPLLTFTRLTSSFPLLASKLSSLVSEFPNGIVDEVEHNQMLEIGIPGRPSFWLNGLIVPEASVDPFALLRLMRKERRIVTQLRSILSTTSNTTRQLLLHSSISEALKPGGKVVTTPEGRVSPEVLGELFDASDRPEGGNVIFWWNDLEKDKKYQTWSRDLQEFLRPTYPGQMNKVAYNLNQVVFILDLAEPSALSLVVEQVRTFINRGIPVRFGLVPRLGQENGHESTIIASAFWYLSEAMGRVGTIKFFSGLLKGLATDRIDPTQVRETYESFALEHMHLSGGPLASFDEMLELSIGERMSKTRAYSRRLGVSTVVKGGEGKVGAFFLNGAFFEFDEDWAQNLQRTLSSHVQFEQQEVYFGHLSESTDVVNFFYDLPSTLTRRNRLVFITESNPLKTVNLLEATKGLSVDSGKDDWLYSRKDEELRRTTSIYVVGDLHRSDGRQLARTALRFVKGRSDARIAFVQNPRIGEGAKPQEWVISNLVCLMSEEKLSKDVTFPGPREDIDIVERKPDEVELELEPDEGQRSASSLPSKDWRLSAELARRLGFKSGELGFVINGRVVGPFEQDDFETADLVALVEYERSKRIDPIVEALDSLNLDMLPLDQREQANLIALTSSIIAEAYEADPAAGLSSGKDTVERRRDYKKLWSEHSGYIGPNEEDALFEIAVVVDPATELAQRWAPILETLAGLGSVHLRIYFNPLLHLKELPIKRFYKFSFDTSPRFDSSTGQELVPQVRFEGIPEDVLLTFAMDTPKAWLAFPKSSVHDLDNIRLQDLPSWAKQEGVEAEFELENLVVEGHARQSPGDVPPRGLQLELVKESGEGGDEQRVDTIVMANLGYFQFKASPGPWRLGLRTGKSSQVFSMESTGADGWRTGSIEETGDELVVSTLEGLTLFPRFKRNPGHETTALLDDSDKMMAQNAEEPNVVDRVRNMFPFLRKTDIATKKKAEINVFTVASGLLYERMAFLMVVSVMRHTKSTVKFWFIQNFLSPSFRAFIPHLAHEYGFEYELVTYKWPHWLRAQTEKQRTIWGYKILFLDVLFPLELDRVIFVDSDQIVRTDLKQLVDLDLKGAPYAYAPMGDDRPEMDRFRFWKTGYWKDHLRGKPYHISALYVVDLDRFRAMAAGDRLRQQYQGLSADPKSLANLDQDLPNNMQDLIPIYTLDRSWLWCETWCSDASLSEAKTIDLCNNPLTHEPKLRRAKRLIPEWTVYDDEVAALAKRVATKEEVGVFGGRADELGQAKGQKEELEAFVKEKSGEGEKVELKPVAIEEQEAEGRVKDEL